MFLGRSWFRKRELPWRKLLFPRLVIAGLETLRSFVGVIAGLKTLRSSVWVKAGLKTLRSFPCGRRIGAVGVNPELVQCHGPCAEVGWTGALGLGETKTQVMVREDLSQTLIFQLEFSP
jgi:hypothetical protein